MNKLYWRLVFIVLAVPAFRVEAQLPNDTIHLKFTGRRFVVKSTPYGIVQALDNRIDTVAVYTQLAGILPPPVYRLGSQAAIEIQEYLQEAIHSVPHGSDRLLINLRQLRGTNKSIRHRRSILLTADLYRQRKDGLYCPVVTIKKSYPITHTLAVTIAWALNDVLAIASSNPNKKTSGVGYATDTTGYLLTQINTPVQDTWAHYPVMEAVVPAVGIYAVFDDFRNNRPVPNHFQLQYIAKDSTCRLVSGTKKSTPAMIPWGIVDSGILYIRVVSNIYVRASRCRNTWCFYVPYALPDMYALLCIEWQRNMPRSGSAGPATSPLFDLAKVAVEATADVIASNAAERKLMQQGMKSGFRFCSIDMDTGDILFAPARP